MTHRRQYFLVGLLAAALVWITSPVFAETRLLPKNTRTVIAGVLNYEDPSIISFPTQKRKDLELDQTLDRMGIPRSQRKLLLDEAATTAAIHKAVEDTVKSSRPGETLFFYYAGHGSVSSGRLVMTSFDRSRKNKRPGYSADALEKSIAKGWRGERVVLMGDFCYSGNFAGVAKKLRAKGIEAISVTSASESNQSTGSWSFTQSIIDGLSGRSLIDHDGDGVITLQELAGEVDAVMRTREAQKSGFNAPKDLGSLVIAETTPRRLSPKTPKSRWSTGDWVCTPQGAARVVETGKRSIVAETYAYNAYVRKKVDNLFVTPFRLQRWPAGADVDVIYNGKEYAAKIIDVKDDFHKITYPGWSKEWDEWITSDRIVRCRGRGQVKMEVHWQGKWYPSSVLCTEGAKNLINYTGYDRCWNEWVPPARLRTARK